MGIKRIFFIRLLQWVQILQKRVSESVLNYFW
jgi:hypothetical protein